MDEVKFVLKCLVVSCLLMVFSQIRIGPATVEERATFYLQHSATAHFLRSAALGGIKMAEDGYERIRDFAYQKTNHQPTSIFKNGSHFEPVTEKRSADDQLENSEDRF